MRKVYKKKGFTLIELLIAVAIIAILSTLAGAYYNDYIKKTNTEYGMQKLLEVIARQKVYFLQNRTYTLSFTDLNYPATLYSKDEYYQLRLSACDRQPLTQCAKVTAQPLTNKTLTDTITATTQGEHVPADLWK